MAKTSKLMRLSPSVPVEIIERRIYLIRGQRVMLDRDLAELYRVPTKRLNQQVRRNRGRFPNDFMFQLTANEVAAMRSHFVTASKRNVRFRPLAFTEQGVAMLSSILASERAVQINILIMRVFVRVRHLLARNQKLTRRIQALEAKDHEHDVKFEFIFEAIDEITAAKKRNRRRIGFTG